MSTGRWPKAIGLMLAAGLLATACGGSTTSTGPKKYIVGKVKVRWWPLQDARIF